MSTFVSRRFRAMPAAVRSRGAARQRARQNAALILLTSVAISGVGNTFMGPHFMDLHAISAGSAGLRSGHVYDSHPVAEWLHGPVHHMVSFVYPPFAAMVLYPLHWFPVWLQESLWFIAVVAATYGVVRVTLKILDTGDSRGAMLWTAAGLWFEPVLNTLALGQVNVFLTLMALYAVYVKRNSTAGLLIGIAAACKLTPAVAWLYLAGQRRYSALVASVFVFVSTVVFSFLVFPKATTHYVDVVFGDATVMPYSSAINQSWRGGLSRILGYDAQHTPELYVAIAATAILALFAWRAVDDPLGRLLVVEIFGLLVSPISWTHHWVWLLPLLIWLFSGPVSQRCGARALRWGWVALMLLAIPNYLVVIRPNDIQESRPWYLAWLAMVYVIAAIITLTWMVFSAPANSRISGNVKTARADAQLADVGNIVRTCMSHSARYSLRGRR